MQEQPLYTGITGKLGHGAAIRSASWLGLHDTGVTLQQTAGRGQSCPGWDLPLKSRTYWGRGTRWNCTLGLIFPLLQTDL